MSRLNLNSIDSSIFTARANGGASVEERRADVIAEGRAIFFEHARRGQEALYKAMSSAETPAESIMTKLEYNQLNRVFQSEHLLLAAEIADLQKGASAPKSFEDFKAQGMNYCNNAAFMNVLAGIYQEIITPILPAVYSEAVSTFADTVEVGFGETLAVSIGSNDIPVFQDSAWGASRSVPANRFYSKDYTLNPQPKTAEMRFKWHQMVGNNMDYGVFFANMVAGMYAKTMGMWNQALYTAASNTALIPTGLTATFSSQNWVRQANKVAAVNNTRYGNVFATGGAVALSKVLPTQATGSTNTNMDAALVTLLGADYIRSGRLGEFMGVDLMPLQDVIIPGTQNTTVQTMLSESDLWMMASTGRKPMMIGYNSATPITIEVRPELTSSFEIIVNMTIALDSVAVFSSRVSHITI